LELFTRNKSGRAYRQQTPALRPDFKNAWISTINSVIASLSVMLI